MVHSTSDIISGFEAEQRNTVFSALSEYLSTGQYVDISLVCRGQVLRAHKVVLSSSSKYFKDFFRHQPGVNIIDLDKELAPNDLSLTLEDVQLIIGILYCVGTVEISPQRIETLLICAQVLGIPTLISFLKKIRDSINESKLPGKAGPAGLEYNTNPALPSASLLTPHHKLRGPTAATTAAGRCYNSSAGPRRSSNGELLYLLPPGPALHPAPPRTSLLPATAGPAPGPVPFSSVPTLPTFSRPAGSPSPHCPTPRSPLLDLSVVKPLTASCVNSPAPGGASEPGSSPLPGPSRNVRKTPAATATRPRSIRMQDRVGPPGVQDSLLSSNPHKVDPEIIFPRESSRISTASYSSFSLNYLHSPRLKSTENSAGENQQSLDGFDQNFFMSLNGLQANQLDDLENVLLPHLSMDTRSDNPLLDLNNLDGVENNCEEQDVSRTDDDVEDGEPETTSDQISENAGAEAQEGDKSIRPACTNSSLEVDPAENSNSPLTENLETDTEENHDDPPRPGPEIHRATAGDPELDKNDEESSEDKTNRDDSETLEKADAILGSSVLRNSMSPKCTAEIQLPAEKKRQTEFEISKIAEKNSAEDIRQEVETLAESNDNSLKGVVGCVVGVAGLQFHPVTPVRLTPGLQRAPVTPVTPVRLTPQGGIALTPLKHLMPDTESAAATAAVMDKNVSVEEDTVDELDGSGPAAVHSEHSSEIVMKLDKVCEGQKMKFSIPGISQAVTVNFSVEALQEMKNAALNQNQAGEQEKERVGLRTDSGQDPQYSEISSSEKSALPDCRKDSMGESSQPNKITKKKNNKRNLRQKLKSNTKFQEKSLKTKNFLCTICSKTFSSILQLEKHQKFHVQKCFSCKLCHEIFEKKWLYDQHLTEKHNQQLERTICPECKKEFSQRTLLLAHMQTFHKKESVFKCFICSLDFGKKHNLIAHLNSWHPNEKFPCCPVCMDIFMDQKTLENHDCPGAEIKNREIICHLHQNPISFTSRAELDAHLKVEHGTEGNFNISCCICHKKFLLRNNLLKHLRNVHKQGDGTKYYCKTCGKEFYYKDDLKNHSMVHQTDQTHVCPQGNCNKAYSTLKALKKHQKLAHDVDLDLVTCKICNKKLSTKFKLKTHMLVHSNAKPFSCTHCSETFKEKRNVVKHIKLKHVKSRIKAKQIAAQNIENQKKEIVEKSEDSDERSVEKSSGVGNEVIVDTECKMVNEVDQPDSTEQTE